MKLFAVMINSTNHAKIETQLFDVCASEEKAREVMRAYAVLATPLSRHTVSEDFIRHKYVDGTIVDYSVMEKELVV